MNDLLAIDAATLFFLLVPGFVAIKVYDLLVPAAPRSWNESLGEAVGFGAINLSLFGWVIHLGEDSAHPVVAYLTLAFVVLVAPALLAVTTRAVRGLRALRGWLVHPTPTAWDDFFGRAPNVWVLCHLKSGAKIGGFFGQESFASGFPAPAELYIEKVWRVSPTGEFETFVERTAGLLVRREECELIEFFAKEPTDGREGPRRGRRAGRRPARLRRLLRRRQRRL